MKPEDMFENQTQGIQHIVVEENPKRSQSPRHVFINKTICKRQVDRFNVCFEHNEVPSTHQC